MKLRGPAAFLAALALASCGAGAAAGEGASGVAWPEGLYGNVWLSAESGDLGGFEVRFFEADGRKMAEFVLCEGWCNARYRAEVVRDGDGFAIEQIEELSSSDGRIVTQQLRFRLTPTGKGLALEGWTDSTKMEMYGRDTLLPIEQPFGLDVAKDMSGE